MNEQVKEYIDKFEFDNKGEQIDDSNIIHINGGVHKYHLVFGKSDMCN